MTAASPPHVGHPSRRHESCQQVPTQKPTVSRSRARWPRGGQRTCAARTWGRPSPSRPRSRPPSGGRSNRSPSGARAAGAPVGLQYHWCGPEALGSTAREADRCDRSTNTRSPSSVFQATKTHAGSVGLARGCINRHVRNHAQDVEEVLDTLSAKVVLYYAHGKIRSALLLVPIQLVCAPSDTQAAFDRRAREARRRDAKSERTQKWNHALVWLFPPHRPGIGKAPKHFTLGLSGPEVQPLTQTRRNPGESSVESDLQTFLYTSLEPGSMSTSSTL